ncbi:COG4315 family predicted lipoprotein [Roseibium sp. SCP14]|uniref:COG4315 family predicted lipoprotein n=1 Tax=Roseibium sp. SCP14 TaxID=3141375 RepID=UPI003339F62A
MMLKSLALTGATLIVSTMAASADGHTGAPAVAGEINGKSYLMDAHKMTLYTFDKDKNGVSNCYDACAEKWPPLLGEDGTTLTEFYSLVERKDGTWQVAYKGQPLYLWFKDEKPGDMTGDGVKGVWHTARP